jgi:hypothetical protein
LGVDRELWDDTSRELLSNLSLTSYKPPAHLMGSGVARTGLPAEDPSSLLGVSGADEKNGVWGFFCLCSFLSPLSSVPQSLLHEWVQAL